MGKNSRKIKLFKEVITKELGVDLDIKIEDIKLYKEQVNNVLVDFIECKPDSLKDIDLNKKFPEINWNLLHNLYFLTCNSNEISQELVEQSKKNRNSLTIQNKEEIPDLMGLGMLFNNPMFKGMIDRVLPVVEKAFEGKDLSKLNINDIMNGIMTKDSEKCGGIDVNNLIMESMNVLNKNKE